MNALQHFGCTIAGVSAAMLTTLALAVQTNELDAALKLKPDREHGRALYETCAACHQADGSGVADGDIPAIAGQHYPVILKQLADFRDTERIELRMNAFAARHHLEGAQDLADVAAYISSLPVQPTTAHGPGKYAGFGRQAYERACQSCHGETAAGDEKARVPRLAGQHYGYLVKQIEMMIAGERRNVHADHPKLLDTLTGEDISGVADFLARLDPVTRP
jgi:cytochrome c553